MQDLLKEFHNDYKIIIEPYIEFSDNLNEIYQKIQNKYNINLNEYKFNIIERKTEKGFKLNFHRDNYLIRKFDNYKWIPYDKEPLPKFSLIHYLNDDFEGGEFILYPNTIIKPKKNMFIFIDSNTIHKVNLQKNGERHVKLYKFYK